MLGNLTVERKLYNGVGKFKPEKVGNFTPEMTKEESQVVKKTAYVVFTITTEGKKDILGIWIGEAESSKFWMNVLADLKNRGVKDLLIASVDGLKGFEEAIKATFSKAEIQKCIVHPDKE